MRLYANLVLINMGEVQLNQVVRIFQFLVEDRACHAAETLGSEEGSICGAVACIAHAAQEADKGFGSDVLLVPGIDREQEIPVASNRLQLMKRFHRL